MRKTLMTLCCLSALLLLPACESNTAKQWQDVFNNKAGSYGKKAGR